jgi:hypothetical protein
MLLRKQMLSAVQSVCAIDLHLLVQQFLRHECSQCLLQNLVIITQFFFIHMARDCLPDTDGFVPIQ